MANINHNLSISEKRKRRVRSKLHGTPKRPRLTVNKSNKYTYLQVIDDTVGKTLIAASDVAVKKALKKGKTMTKTQGAVQAAEELANKMKKSKISAVVFDRGQYKYHGRVKAIAETLREAGIKV